MKSSPPPEAPLRVLYIGRLSPEKGVDILLRAWSLLLNTPSPISGVEHTAPLETPPSERGVARSAPAYPPPSERGVARSAGGSTPTSTASANHSSLFTLHSSLTIVGDGPERPMLESLATTRGIADRVEFTGAMSRSSARAALASASLLVLPSICYETFGLAILEAASLGIPSIVTNIGGQSSLVQDGITGRHIPPSDPVALATALRELLANPASLHRMGDAARAAFETSDCIPCRNLARLERVYASCLHDA